MKEFDDWNKNKKLLEQMQGKAYAHPREIWWCSLGINVGAEVDGKNENFERPVLVIKVYNKETLLILPITSKIKEDRFHYKITYNKRQRALSAYIKLTQARVISNKRLLRKVDTLDPKVFSEIRTEFTKHL